MSNTTPTIAPTQSPDVVDSPADDTPWVVLLHNDPVNIFSYVIRVLRKVFGYSEAKARTLTEKAHTEGKAAVWSGSREEAEKYVAILASYSLWATLVEDR